MSAVQLNLIVLRAADCERLARFYSRLGLAYVKHRHGGGPEHYACELGATVFEIYPRRADNDRTGAVRIGFQVPSVDAAVAALEADGETISAPKDSPWGRRAVVEDPEGHRVELTEARGTAALASLSETALAEDWTRAEEEAAWAHLQKEAKETS